MQREKTRVEAGWKRPKGPRERRRRDGQVGKWKEDGQLRGTKGRRVTGGLLHTGLE